MERNKNSNGNYRCLRIGKSHYSSSSNILMKFRKNLKITKIKMPDSDKRSPIKTKPSLVSTKTSTIKTKRSTV